MNEDPVPLESRLRASGASVPGVIFAPVLRITGTMLCLAGLGALAGVPMIILVILSPLIGPTLGINAVRGSCPWCGAKVGSVVGQ